MYPTNNMPIPNAQTVLPIERVKSSIPKGGNNDDETWVYPSPQMFYNALARKGKLAMPEDEGEDKKDNVAETAAVVEPCTPRTRAVFVAAKNRHLFRSLLVVLRFDLHHAEWLAKKLEAKKKKEREELERKKREGGTRSVIRLHPAGIQLMSQGSSSKCQSSCKFSMCSRF